MSKLTVTGIDVGTKYIRAAVIIHNGKSYTLASLQKVSATDSLFSANYLFNYQEIVKKLQAIKRTLPRFSKKVAVSLPDTEVLDGLFHIEAGLEGVEEEFAIEQALGAESPVPVEDLNIDYCNVSSDITSSAHSYYVCAARSELAVNRTEALQKAGLKPVMLESESRSLFHVLELTHAEHMQKGACLLYAGETDITLCGLFRNHIPFFRTIASELLNSGQAIRQCYQEIQTQIQLLSTSPDYASPEKLYLAGNWFEEELAHWLSEKLGLPVTFVDLPELLPGAEWAEQSQPELFIKAVGLAIGGIRWMRGNHDS